MARRNELGSIASGLIGSFSSRNNDIGGYWGLGKLHKFVENDSKKEIMIDLLSGNISPQTDEFDSLIESYRDRLDSHLTTGSIPKAWLVSVELTVLFEPEYEKKHHYWRSGLGKPYKAKCDILDDNGKHHVAYAYNNSQPHDPNREARSCR
ncbi:hypothetical protein CXF83_06660 [Shewanella sp. Choline-02u-19]|uniref:hypothetical protein n=1 Tax=unclassified Shewanella TaxID=196818 RepID=UPI000C3205D9|nr:MULTISPECIES: hypothetical protein [unclassified Shewanella]PKH56757.1 hypothetical protein CXF84_12680 [Shewanella sp. Bg11-22]PKI30308.1 hypothetical protein CXF83_06660 [Shewanella sp. Choline-02u-19]